MGYVVDRTAAFRDTELVAILSVRRRGVRSRLLLCDGSRHPTLTRPTTMIRTWGAFPKKLKGVVWRSQPKSPSA